MARKPKEEIKKAEPSDEDKEREAIQQESEKIPTEDLAKEEPPPVAKYTVLPRLGFGPPPGATLVYVGGSDDPNDSYCWYTLQGEMKEAKRVPVYDNSLIGYLSNIRVVPKPKYKKPGEWDYKVYITLLADKEYILRSGVDTEFTVRVVNSLARVEDFSRPICITVSRGEEAKVIFGHVSDGITNWGIFVKNADCPDKISPVIFGIQQRLGVEVQSGESIKKQIADMEAKNR